MKKVIDGMEKVNEKVDTSDFEGEGCGEDCMLEVESADLIGRISLSFNKMIKSISQRIEIESMTRSLQTELSSSTDMQFVVHSILDHMMRVCAAKAGVVYGDTGSAFELIVEKGVGSDQQPPAKLDRSHGLAKTSLKTGALEIISSETQAVEWLDLSTPLGNFRPRSIILAPLVAEQKAVGLVVIASSFGTLSDEQMEQLDALRIKGAPYLQNAILHKKLIDLAAIDELTQLLNRRFGKRRFDEEFSRSVRHGIPVSVMMLDVDHFKKFNDEFGHDAGDMVLKFVSRVMEKNVRAGDVLYRYGGEEFCVVTPGTGINDSVQIATRIRRAVETSKIGWGQHEFSVTVSIGVATWPIVHASTSEEVLIHADKALYFAKETGRNKVAVSNGDELKDAAALDIQNEAASRQFLALVNP